MKLTSNEEIRLDKFLLKHIDNTRAQIEILIKKHGITVNDKLIKKCGYKLKVSDEITYHIPPPEENIQKNLPIDFDIEILYEDEDLLVINKPPNLVVHPAPSVKEATLVDWLKKQKFTLSNINNEERNGIVHRIDKQTSGALLVAKNNKSHLHLSTQLQDKSMGRYYLAILDMPLKENTIIESYLTRNPNNRLKIISYKEEYKKARYAKSAFSKIALSNDDRFELIGAKLFTGRTHQIRSHLESMSRHILGDDLYGFKSKISKISVPRIMLHAYLIYFVHPRTNEKVLLKAPLGNDFKHILDKRFDLGEEDEQILPDNIISSFSSFI